MSVVSPPLLLQTSEAYRQYIIGGAGRGKGEREWTRRGENRWRPWPGYCQGTGSGERRGSSSTVCSNANINKGWRTTYLYEHVNLSLYDIAIQISTNCHNVFISIYMKGYLHSWWRLNTIRRVARHQTHVKISAGSGHMTFMYTTWILWVKTVIELYWI